VTGRVADPLRAFAAPEHSSRQPGIVFRPVLDADLPFLADLYASTREAELAPVPWPDEAKRAFLLDQFNKQHDHYQQHYQGADYWVIERDGEPIGRVYVYRSPGEIRLMDIALLPEQRGRGLGSALLTELLDEADRQAAQITLHVEAENPVKRLYQRLGFVLIEQRGPYDFLSRPTRTQGGDL
jgi:ribosomal protein S18 acetylase RimI-like enzyme